MISALHHVKLVQLDLSMAVVKTRISEQRTVKLGLGHLLTLSRPESVYSKARKQSANCNPKVCHVQLCYEHSRAVNCRELTPANTLVISRTRMPLSGPFVCASDRLGGFVGAADALRHRLICRCGAHCLWKQGDRELLNSELLEALDGAIMVVCGV